MCQLERYLILEAITYTRTIIKITFFQFMKTGRTLEAVTG